MNEDGTMARGPELEEVARTHGLKMVTVADIISFRLMTETFVRKVAESQLSTRFGEFRVLVFENALDGEHHVALVKGEISGTGPTLVRVQEQMTLRDVFGCPSGGGRAEMDASFRAIEREDRGVFVYLRLEGKGSGLVGEVKGSPPENPDTGAPGSDFQPALAASLRNYGVGAQILRELGVRRIRLLTNHPRKIVALQGFGIAVSEQIPLETDLAACHSDLPSAHRGPAGSAAGSA
jgi:3,4-dihydroxy 2-butanone 4-phosphate synthase / GTP cyclohydrolase II